MMLVLTRPLKDSNKLKLRIESASSHQCFVQPLLEIEILDKKIDIPDDAVVAITSANGIRALAKNTKKRGYRIIAVGEYTAKKARKKGFRNVECATESKQISASELNLFKYISKKVDKTNPVYHISANITKGGLKRRLLEAGYKYKRVALYNSTPMSFTPEFIDRLERQEFDAFSFFSPRTAAIFAKQIDEAGLSDKIQESVAFCFSTNVVQGLSGLIFKKIVIPGVTNKENFIKLVCDYR